MAILSEFLNTSVSGASLPSQTGQSAKFLTTDGSNLSWGQPQTIPDIDGGAASTTDYQLELDGGDVNAN